MDRNVNIITDLKGNKIVLINDIIFKGKRSVNWDDVKNYLEIYVGEFYEIADTNDIVYIGIYWFAIYIFAERGECEGKSKCIAGDTGDVGDSNRKAFQGKFR